MFSKPVRFALIAAALGVGLAYLWQGDSTGAWFIVAAALFVYGHFRYGPVHVAFRALQAGDRDRAARLLSQVKSPSALSSQHRAYFEFVSGALCTGRGSDAEAEQHYRAALAHSLRTSNDRCVVELEIARLLAKRGERGAALELLAQAGTRQMKPEVADRLGRMRELLETEA